MNGKTIYIWGITYVTLAIAIFCFIYFRMIADSQKNLLNAMSIIGTIVSSIGFLFTIQQLFIARKQITEIDSQNKIIKEEVSKAINSLNTILSVADLEKANRFVNYIIDKINNKEYNLAYLRMNDLEEILIGIREKKSRSKQQVTKDYTPHLQKLKSDMNYMNRYFSDPQNNVDFHRICEHLNDVSTIIIESKNKIIN